MDDAEAKRKSAEEEALRYLSEPPPCAELLQRSIVEIKENILIADYIVKKEFCNPAGSMQGGFITAAFDCTFGPLSHICMKSLTVTIDISTQFHAPIYPPDILIIEAEAVKLGKTILYMRGIARNQNGKLIATADTTFMAMKSKN